MRSPVCNVNKFLFAASVAALAALSWTPSTAWAGPTGAAPAPTAAPASQTLKRLPAGRDELVFRGETATRAWGVYLSQSEASHIAAFQLALLNSVVVLPERSWVRVTINGRALPALPVRSPDKVTNFALKIPPGVLAAGANKIQVSVALAHRVDCSVQATYELWASLDPAQTGFMLDEAGAYAVRSLDNLAAEPTASDGATHIHVRMADSPDAEGVARAARFVNALVRRGGLSRPLVDIGPDAGAGPGFDVVLTPGSAADADVESLRILGRSDGVTLGRDSATNRLVIVMSASNEADLDAQISALESAAPSAAATQPTRENVVVDGAFRRSFGELGLSTDGFAGRHYLANASVTLPADFYPASYQKSRLFIDGGHSAALDQNSELIFRVNGVMAASMTLAAGRAERFDHKPIELPLRLFHPGQNEVSVEGIASSALDQQCDVATLPRESRLTIASSSEFEFPQFARLATLPQIPSAIADGAAAERAGRLHLYLQDLDPNSISAALSVLANMTATQGPVGAPIVHLEPPTVADVPGIVIASFGQLPEHLSAPLREVASLPAATNADDEDRNGGGASGSVAADVKDAAPTQSNSGAASGLSAFLEPEKALSWTDGLLPAGARGDAHGLSLPQHFLLVGAVGPEADSKIAGVRLPQFTRESSQWLVVTAQSAEAYKAGVDRLVAEGQWRALAGQAVSLDTDSGQLQSIQPVRVTYVTPRQFVLSDVRPILGGIFSDNILLSLAGLVLLMSALGLSTHALVRQMGVRR